MNVLSGVFQSYSAAAWNMFGITSAGRPKDPNKGSKRGVKRGVAFTGTLLTAAIALNADYLNLSLPSTQISLAWPADGPQSSEQPIKYDLKRYLERVLNDLDRKRATWNDQVVAQPIGDSIYAAMRIVAKLPNRYNDGKVGIDRDGHVFLHLKGHTGEAYLTVEPTQLHLLKVAKDGSNLYVDDAPFNGKKLPVEIRRIVDAV